jgi:hypothetical protein
MPILVDRIGRTEVNCTIWLGRVSRSEALALPARLDPALPEIGVRWLNYFDLAADLSDLDAACLLELRDRLRPAISALAAKGQFRSTLATSSRYIEPLLAVWRTMTALDVDYPSDPVIAHDIASAAHALGLSSEEAELARLWIESRIAGMPGDAR